LWLQLSLWLPFGCRFSKFTHLSRAPVVVFGDTFLSQTNDILAQPTTNGIG
jgi:hypothetical protein